MRWLIAVAIVLMLATTCENAASAQPRVVDGDTLVIDGVTYRIEGIDAPELHQRCADGWFAGVSAASALRHIVRFGAVCVGTARDKYGRTVARCHTRDVSDIGYSMVRSGYAFAYPAYSERYVVAETQANSEGLGVHWYGCMRPDAWRKQHRSTP